MSHGVYPAPTLVIGVGRLGLALAERLAEDWMGLRLSGADPSIRNLRLVTVREAPGDADAWRRRERPAARVSRYLGEGDLPSRALDLVILRSLGLVRYHDGTYEVGLPRDAGVVEAHEGEGEREAGPAGRRLIYRRRHFEWVPLSPDPIVAAERLRQATEQSKELDLFLTPLVNRVRQGSPAALLGAIDRCFALLAGRDPSPWRWLGERLAAARPDGGEPVELALGEEVFATEPGAREAEHHLAEIPVPLPGYRRWLDGEGALLLSIPAPFVPGAGDPVAPIRPRTLLERDWQATSWALDGDDEETATFHPVPATPLRLGFFDHDSRSVDGEVRERLRGRIVDLGRQVHRGLVRLWTDLQRVRVAETDTHLRLQGRVRDAQVDALQQSLEILGELVVRPLVAAGDDGEDADESGRAAATSERDLPSEPSRFLAGMVVDEGTEAHPVRRRLEERLADLGLGTPDEIESFRRPLATDHALAPEDLDERSDGVRALRRTLNARVRELYDLDFLRSYRTQATRRPPRLTVYVVGDMGEPFVRASLQSVLRAVHAELLRAFTPLFRTYREGFDRSLCVTPILWMPHPADPFHGGSPVPTRCEEAAIIDAVHGIRHWVECVLPAGKRFIPQIFVNSRVSDIATLTLRDAIRQTRDFLSFQIRSDLAGDPWLRSTSSGSGQADLFSSFSCYETDFPALRCREYLANRMGRELLEAILEPSESTAGRDVSAVAEARDEELARRLAPPPVDRLVSEIRHELDRVTARDGGSLREIVVGALAVTESTSAADVEAAYGDRFETDLRRRVLERWRALTGRAGRVDDHIDALRRETTRLLDLRVRELREHSDEAILDSIGEGGLTRALGRLHTLRVRCQETFREREAARRACEELARRHAIPELAPLSNARAELLAAARAKPDVAPMRLGALLLAALALALGGPLAQSVAYWHELHLEGGMLETLLGPLGPLTGGLALWLPAVGLLRWWLRRRTRAVAAARDRLGETADRLLRGAGLPVDREPAPSIRSFLEARVELTAAVATRGFALHVLERLLADMQLAERLRRSVDVQRQILARRAEDLGVRSPADAGEDDLGRLLEGHGEDRSERLIGADSLRRYYRQVMRHPADVEAELPSFVPAAGGISRWRTEACLADTGAILDYCRWIFRGVVEEAVWAQPFFRDDVARRLGDFVARNYSNLGFAAEFRGYEGLDPDGVPVLADATLLLHPELARVFAEARQDGGVPSHRTLQVYEADIRPNAAYMLSLVQGIRVHSLRNLRRFESFHERTRMPDDRTFPLTQETREPGDRPLNLLSGLEETSRQRTRALLPERRS